MSHAQALEDQLLEAEIDDIKLSRKHSFGQFTPPDAELAGAIEGGKMGMTKTDEENVTLYSQLDGEPRIVRINQVAKHLKKTLPDGRRALGPRPPEGVKYELGKFLCHFHPDHPNRQMYVAMGLASATCMSAHLASEFDAELHAQHRHSKWWAAAKAGLEAKRRDEEAARQEATLAAMLKLAEGGTKRSA